MSESISTAESATHHETKRENFEREAIPHLDLLYRYGLRLTGDSHQAEDLVQNTMLKAYRSWHQYQMGTNVRAWLVTILRNCFINEYRKSSRAGVHIDVNAIEQTAVCDDREESDPEGHFVDQEFLPPSLKGRRYYHPTQEGSEKEVGERLKRWWGEPESGQDKDVEA